MTWWQSRYVAYATAWNYGVEFVSLKAAHGVMQKRTSAAAIVLAPLQQGFFSLTQERKGFEGDQSGKSDFYMRDISGFFAM